MENLTVAVDSASASIDPDEVPHCPQKLEQVEPIFGRRAPVIKGDCEPCAQWGKRVQYTRAPRTASRRL